jgi:hypothetical protein
MGPAKSRCMTEEEIPVAYLTYLGEDGVYACLPKSGERYAANLRLLNPPSLATKSCTWHWV